MMRSWALTLFAAVALTAAGCGPQEGEKTEAEAEEQLPAPLARCDLDGIWSLDETPTAATGCDDEWAPFIDAYLQVRQQDEMLEVDYVPEGDSALRCSGLPADDTCSIEMTCEGRTRATDVEAALELTFNPDDDSVSGTRRLEVLGSDCRMTVSIAGRREPEETASQ